MRFRLNPKFTTAFGLTLVVGATISTRVGSALPPSASALEAISAETETEAQFREFIHDSIQKNIEAAALGESYEAWDASGSTPADIMANAEARGSGRADAFAAICRALKNVDDESLARFDSELQK